MGRLQLKRGALIAILACGLAAPAFAQATHGVRINGVNVWANVIFNGGTVIVSTPTIDASQTWNAAGVTFTGWKLNITDTASATASKLIDLQVGSTSLFSINKAGLVALPDGTSGAPALSFGTEGTLGIWRNTSGQMTAQGTLLVSGALQTSGSSSIVSAGDFTLGSSNMIRFTSRIRFRSPADGIFTAANNGETIGVEFKVDALPTVSACGAGSPAVVAGSTPLSGAVTIGTTSVATCTITFNGTAFPSAPHCNGVVETTTAANVRAMGYSASTTVLTIVPSAAWVDSSVVNWDCFSPK